MKRRSGGVVRTVKRIFRRPAARRIAAAVIFVTALLSVRWYNALLRGRVEMPALFSAETAAGQAIDEAASLCITEDAEDLLIREDGGGYRVDAVRLTSTRERFADTLAALLDEKSVIRTSVPLGSLTENQFLSGKGPRVRAKTYARYRITCETKSDFQSVGINQTLFSVKLEATVECSLLFPDGEKTVTVAKEITLAEKVILGEVPLGRGS